MPGISGQYCQGSLVLEMRITECMWHWKWVFASSYSLNTCWIKTNQSVSELSHCYTRRAEFFPSGGIPDELLHAWQYHTIHWRVRGWWGQFHNHGVDAGRRSVEISEAQSCALRNRVRVDLCCNPADYHRCGPRLPLPGESENRSSWFGLP